MNFLKMKSNPTRSKSNPTRSKSKKPGLRDLRSKLEEFRDLWHKREELWTPYVLSHGTTESPPTEREIAKSAIRAIEAERALGAPGARLTMDFFSEHGEGFLLTVMTNAAINAKSY